MQVTTAATQNIVQYTQANCLPNEKKEKCPVCWSSLFKGIVVAHDKIHRLHLECCKKMAFTAKLICPLCRKIAEIDPLLLTEKEKMQINEVEAQVGNANFPQNIVNNDANNIINDYSKVGKIVITCFIGLNILFSMNASFAYSEKHLCVIAAMMAQWGMSMIVINYIL